MEQELRLRIKQTVDSSEIEALHQEMLKVKKDIMDLQALGREKDAFAIADKKKDLLDLRDSLRKAKEILRDVNKEAKLDLKMQGQHVVLGSIEAIQMKLIFLNNEIKKVNPNSDAFLILGQKIAHAEKEMMIAGARLHQTTAGAANMSTAMLNLNYVVRDSPYFFNNFAMGVMAIGNNLNPLIDSMIRAKTAAEALGSTFGKELLKVLAGPSGVIFFFSLAVAAFQAITFAMSKSKREAEKNKETIEALIKTHQSFTYILKDAQKEIQNLPLEKLTRAYMALQFEIHKTTREIEDFIAKSIVVQRTLVGFLLSKAGFIYTKEELTKLKMELDKLNKQAEETDITWAKMQATFRLFKDGDIKKAISIFTKEELGNLKTKFEEIANTTLPGVIKTVGLMGFQFQVTAKEAEKISKALGELLGKKDKIKLNLDISTLEGLENLIKEAREGLEKVKFDSKDFDVALEKWNTLKDELERREFEIKLKTENFEELFPELVEIARANFTTDLNELLGVDDFEKESKEIIKNLTKDFEDYAKERTDAIKESIEFLQDLQIDNIEDETQRRIASIKQWRNEQLFAYRESEGERLELVERFTEIRSEIEQRANQEIIEAQINQYKDLITTISNVLESEFREAWGNIFGEANSLFEHLAEAISTKLIGMAIDAGTKKLFESFFDTGTVIAEIGAVTAAATASAATTGIAVTAAMTAIELAGSGAALVANVASFGAAGLAAAGTFGAAAASLMAAKELVKFHEGGIIGKEVPIIAKKGEMILNESQQANLWNIIQGFNQERTDIPKSIKLDIPKIDLPKKIGLDIPNFIELKKEQNQEKTWGKIRPETKQKEQNITIPLTVQIGDEIISKMIYKKLPAIYQTLIYEGYL